MRSVSLDWIQDWEKMNINDIIGTTDEIRI